jgi:hypothetical protein
MRLCLRSSLGVALVTVQALAAPARPAAKDHATLTPTTPVQAESSAQRPLSEVLSGPARVAYESGRLLLEANDSATAHAKFKEAYELSRKPRLLWNMAACSKLQRHYAMAVQELETFLSDGAGQITPEQEARARELLETLRVVVAPIAVKVVPAAARLYVDGEAKTTSAGELRLLLDVGHHEFRAELDGHAPAARIVDLNETKAVAIDLNLAPIVPDAMLAIATLSDAAVEVDGKAFSVGSREAVVTPGLHRVRVWAREHKPWSGDVTVGSGEHKGITAVLEPDEKPNFWLICSGAVLAVAGLSLGAYYIFKPDAPAAPAPIVLQPTPGVGGTITLP